jgi:hypothetical protein
MEEKAPRAPPTQVRATIQRHHPIDQILDDISKGVTTRSRLANFCVAEPPELFQLKCPSRTLKGSNTLKQE